MKNILRTHKNKENKDKKEDTPKIRAIKFNILAVVAIVIFCMSLCPITLQNDTYYTIKIGEHIVNTKTVDMQDPFSWHENMPYTYPHWAYDVIIYLIYNAFGLMGIFISTIVLACVLGVLMYFTNYKISKNKPISFLITIGAMYLMKDYIAARAQLVTFILLELTILLIEKFLETKKVRYPIGIVLISIAIANLHCAVWPFFFVIFLPYIAEYLIFTIIDAEPIYKIKQKIYDIRIKIYNKLLKKKKEKYTDKINKTITKKEEAIEDHKKFVENQKNRRENPYRIKYEKNKATKWLILVMVICAFTGLLTPLGDTPYTYLYKTMQGNTTENISEHLPLTLINAKEILVTLVAVIAILLFTDTKIRLKDLFMLAGLALLMLMTRRQVSMFVLFGSAIIAKLIADLFRKYDNRGLVELEKIMVSTLGTIAVISIIALLAILEIRPKVDDKFVRESSYPVNAATYITENLDLKSIRLFNEYNYGSYLIFRGIPVFIDSRADLYAPEFNKIENSEDAELAKGRDIFSDYIGTSTISRYYEKVFEKYDITHIILSKKSKLNMLIEKDDRYNQIYSDDYFVIYERNKGE